MPVLSRMHGWKLPILSAAGVIFAFASVLARPEPEMRTPQVMPPASPYASRVAGIGVIEPKSEVINLGVELPGVVRQVHVAPGDEVKRGMPLFTLDQRDIDATIAALEATLAASRVQAADAATQYALIASVKDARAVAKDEVNRRRFAKQLAQARVREVEAQWMQANTTRQRLSVNAPLDGQILEVNLRPGEYAAAGTLSAPLIRMGDVSTLHVRTARRKACCAAIPERVFRCDSCVSSRMSAPSKTLPPPASGWIPA